MAWLISGSMGEKILWTLLQLIDVGPLSSETLLTQRHVSSHNPLYAAMVIATTDPFRWHLALSRVITNLAAQILAAPFLCV